MKYVVHVGSPSVETDRSQQKFEFSTEGAAQLFARLMQCFGFLTVIAVWEG